jgi:molybdopterin molybdotransferase
MLNIDAALKLVLDHAKPLASVPTPMSDALGRVLAEAVVSDIDSPPHDKSIVDGYAVIATDIEAQQTELAILEEVTAGAVPSKAVESGAATRIMTGAPLPRGADAVVMVEQTEMSGGRVRIMQPNVRVGQNIVRRATSLACGQTVLLPGKLLRPAEIGLLAEVGRQNVAAIPMPRVGVLGTGNELVEHGESPAAGQIRNSNGPMLAALAESAGATATDLGIARDNRNDLERAIGTALSTQNVVVISGGVSAGVLDLVPGTLAALGVEQVFHKVSLKPGKPLWFGEKSGATGQSVLVFGLPGNPVSSLVCFELFVRPAIQKMRGLMPTGLRRVSAQLSRDHQQRGDRPTYWPALLENERVTPLAWKGSGDLRTLTDANCLVFFPAGEKLWKAGEEVQALMLD